MDPLGGQSFRQRRQLKRRLRKAWRQGLGERKAQTLDQLTELAGRDLVLRTWTDRRAMTSVGEISFASGATIRVAPCSRPMLTHLGRLAADSLVILERAADHGRCWGLYFNAGGTPVGVLAERVSVVHSGGGLSIADLPVGLPA